LWKNGNLRALSLHASNAIKSGKVLKKINNNKKGVPYKNV
jgi:hypothetical protein